MAPTVRASVENVNPPSPASLHSGTLLERRPTRYALHFDRLLGWIRRRPSGFSIRPHQLSDVTPVPALRPLRTHDAWRYAIVAGGASCLVTVATYWESAGASSTVPVFLAGLAAGFLYDGPVDSTTVGVRTGLVAALPGLAFFAEFAVTGLFTVGGPAWFRGVAVLLIAQVAVFLAVLIAATGVLGALLGDWLADELARRRQPATPN